MKWKQSIFATGMVVLFHLYLMISNGYYTFVNVDWLMHLLGGYVMGMLFLSYLNGKNLKTLSFISTIGFVAIIGIFWEIHEFVLDRTIFLWLDFPLSQPSVFDTLKDLVNDLLGGLLAYLHFFILPNKKGGV